MCIAAAATAALGCGDRGGPSAGAPDASLMRAIPLAPGSFVEANVLLGAGAVFIADYTTDSGALEWDLHEHDSMDFDQFVVLESGRGAGEFLSFRAPHAGAYSYRWTNPLEAGLVTLDVTVRLEGDARFHSWGP